jgi:hypothetical protein
MSCQTKGYSQTRNFRVGFEDSQTHDNPDPRYKPIESRPRTVLFLTSQLWRKEVSFLFSDPCGMPLKLGPFLYVYFCRIIIPYCIEFAHISAQFRVKAGIPSSTLAVPLFHPYLCTQYLSEVALQGKSCPVKKCTSSSHGLHWPYSLSLFLSSS